MNLLILPFDHRGSLLKKLYGTDTPSEKQRQEYKRLKKMVYAGFEKALAKGVPKNEAAILVDEEYGSDILKDAKRKRYKFCMPVEKSGVASFEFETENFEKHVSKFNPTFVKVLVRFNPAENNAKQVEKLKRLDAFCRRSRRKYIFELLVPPTPAQSKMKNYDCDSRPELMIAAMEQLQTAGITPDVWKLEGVEKKSDAVALVRQAKGAGIIILGRGENAVKVRKWLKTSARVKGVVGFAVGRTVFWNAMQKMHSAAYTEEKASDEVARNFVALVKMWKKNRGETK
jgi:5-dehydro-2-deoxygluconokinase